MNLKIKTIQGIILSLFIILFDFSTSLIAQTNTIRVKGFVTDEITDERLSSVLILLDNSGIAVSDSKGFFSFNIPPGRYNLKAKIVGYSMGEKIVTFQNGEDATLFFKLKPVPIEVNEITVSGEKYLKEIKYDTYELKQGELNKVPQLGEPDALRSVQSLPGISTIGDHSTQVFLRGGNFDETLISLDGVPLLNPYHIGEIFGIINTDIVQSEIIYPSNFPPNYGGVISGVFNINSRAGSFEEYKGAGTVGLFSSKAFYEGPLFNGSFIVSARRTYLDLLSTVTGLGNFPYYFYDFYGKYTLPVDEKNLFEVSGLYSKDIYGVFKDKNRYQIISKKDNPKWGNDLFNFKFIHLFGKNDYLDFQFYYSESLIKANAKAINLNSIFYNPDYIPDNNIIIDPSTDSINTIKINNSIKNISGKINFVYHFPGQTINAGLGIEKLNSNYSWDIYEDDMSGIFKQPLEKVFFDLAPNPYYNKDETFIYSNYLLYKIQITAKISVSPGYRIEYISKPGEFLFSPFLLVNYDFNSNIEVNLSYGKYYQYFYIIKDKISDDIYAPFSLPFISANYNEIASSHHISAGVKFSNLFKLFKFEVDGYYKKRENISATNENRSSLIFVNGYAAGVDILLKKDNGNLTGWLGYSLSRSVKNGTDYSYFSNFDRTNNIKLFLSYEPFESLSFSAFWTFGSGLPYTPIIGKYLRASNNFSDYEDGRDWEVIEGKRNSQRLKNLHRLDLGLNGTFIWGDLLVKPYLAIMNVYNSPNPYFYDGNANDSNPETGQEKTSFIIPSIGVTIEF